MRYNPRVKATTVTGKIHLGKQETFVVISSVIATWLISKEERDRRWKGSINFQFIWIILLWWGLTIRQSK